jgi:hypothetical protein
VESTTGFISVNVLIHCMCGALNELHFTLFVGRLYYIPWASLLHTVSNSLMGVLFTYRAIVMWAFSSRLSIFTLHFDLLGSAFSSRLSLFTLCFIYWGLHFNGKCKSKCNLNAILKFIAFRFIYWVLRFNGNCKSN